MPDDLPHGLVHNDFRFDNLVLSPTDPRRIIGVLDWEMATVGDPLMDLGGALAYWVEAQDGRLFTAFRRQPTHEMGMLTRRQVVDRYCARTGIELTAEQWLFYEVFGLFRLAVIAQQIHHRYYHGQTTNPAFRTFRLAVVVLEQRCLRLIRGGTRGHLLRALFDGLRLVRPLVLGVYPAVRRTLRAHRRR